MDTVVKTGIAEIDFVFGIHGGMINGELWLLSHLQRIGGEQILSALFSKSGSTVSEDKTEERFWISYLTTSVGVTNLFPDEKGMLVVVPKYSFTPEVLENSIAGFIKEGVTPGAVLVSMDIFDTKSRSFDFIKESLQKLRLMTKQFDVAFLVVAPLGNETNKVVRTYGDKWWDMVSNKGYHLNGSALEDEVDGELLVDFDKASNELSVLLCKSRGGYWMPYLNRLLKVKL